MTEGGFACALDLVKYMQTNYPNEFSIQVAGYPEGHPDRINPVKVPLHTPSPPTPPSTTPSTTPLYHPLYHPQHMYNHMQHKEA